MASPRSNQRTNPNDRVAQEDGAVVVIGADGSAGMPEGEADVETEIEIDNGGGARTSGKGVANSTLGSECSSTGLTWTMTAAAAAEEVGGSTQTKRLGACSCSPVAHTQEAAIRKGTAGEDR